MSFELTTLGAYARVQGGYAYKSKDFSESGVCPVLKIKNVRFGTVDYSEVSLISEEIANETSDWKTKEGDILISMTGSGPNAPQSLVGRVARIWGNEPEAWINQRVGRVVLKEENLIHPDFLFYLLASPSSQDYLVSNSSGSANQANISGKTIESLPCPKVGYEKSAEIAKILRELDQKILTNRQTNQTLEHIAQAIFKSWFVDFEPTRAKIAAKQIAQARQDSERSAALRGALLADGRWSEAVAAAIAEGDPERAAMAAISGKSLDELDQLSPEQQTQLLTTAALFPDALVDSELGEIPDGWKEGSVGNVAIAKGGFAFKGKSFVEEGNPVVKIKNITGDGRVDLNGAVCIDDEQAKSSKRFKLEDGDLLMAMTGATVGKIGFVVTEGKSVYLNQRVAKFESEKFGDKIAWFLFCCFERDSIFDAVVSSAQGSAQPNISSSGIESTKLILPSDELIHLFCGKAASLFKKWLSTINENSVLKENRDSLLPKLLSGELQVVDKGKTA